MSIKITKLWKIFPRGTLTRKTRIGSLSNKIRWIWKLRISSKWRERGRRCGRITFTEKSREEFFQSKRDRLYSHFLRNGFCPRFELRHLRLSLFSIASTSGRFLLFREIYIRFYIRKCIAEMYHVRSLLVMKMRCKMLSKTITVESQQINVPFRFIDQLVDFNRCIRAFVFTFTRFVWQNIDIKLIDIESMQIRWSTSFQSTLESLNWDFDQRNSNEKCLLIIIAT